MFFKNISFYLLILTLIISTFLTTGCAERERKETGVSGTTDKANQALAKAEEEMDKAGIGISFEELQGLESLSDLATILPDPLELEQMEDPLELEQMESSIHGATSAMYEVLEALGIGIDIPAAPMQALEQIGSDTDLAMIHLHIAYLYIYDVIFRLVKVQKDPNTGEVIYHISFPEEPTTENIEEIYQIELTEEGQRRLNQAIEGAKAEAFTKEQRQSIINSLYLLLGAKAEVTVDGVTQKFNIDTTVFRRDALYHFKEMLEFAKKLAPEIKEGLEELSEILSSEENFARRMLDRAEIEWGFEVTNRDEVIERIESLTSQ